MPGKPGAGLVQQLRLHHVFRRWPSTRIVAAVAKIATCHPQTSRSAPPGEAITPPMMESATPANEAGQAQRDRHA